MFNFFGCLKLFGQDQYDYLVRVMERWREPWESEEEKEIFVSNVMQQVDN